MIRRGLQVVPIALFLEAATLKKTVSLDLTLGPEGLAKYKKEPGRLSDTKFASPWQQIADARIMQHSYHQGGSRVQRWHQVQVSNYTS